MGYQHQSKSDARTARKIRRKADEDNWQSAKSPNVSGLSNDGILNLQRTIGNRAVQRLILQRDVGDTDAVQADSGKAKDKAGEQDADSLPSFMATLTGAQQGEIKSKSRVAGHEGKLEIVSLSFKEEGRDENKKMIVQLTRRVDDASPLLMNAWRNGESLKTAHFVGIRRTDRGTIENGQTFDFSDGVIAGYQISSSNGIPYESITLEFAMKPKPPEKKE